MTAAQQKARARTSAVRLLAPLILWALLALFLHLPWEMAQLPLYTLWQRPDNAPVALYVWHCILGDVGIATALYLLTALLSRRFRWPAHRPWIGGAVYVTTALAYTAWSEWRNVYRTGGWAYTAAMPTVAGIGLTPLLQWIVVSVLMVAMFRLIEHLLP